MKVLVAKVGEVLFDGEAYSITLPAVQGEITVLAHHMPVVTPLKAGVVRIHDTQGSTPREFAIESGVLEVTGEGVVVLL